MGSQEILEQIERSGLFESRGTPRVWPEMRFPECFDPDQGNPGYSAQLEGPAPPMREGPGLDDSRSSDAEGPRPMVGQGLGLLHDLFLESRGNLLIFAELHAEAPLALGHASQVVRIAEHLGQRDFRGDDREAGADSVRG